MSYAPTASLAVVAAALHAGGALWPDILWGTHHAGFLSIGVQVTGYLMAALALVPRWPASTRPVQAAVTRARVSLRPAGRLLPVAVAAVGAMLFFSFPQQHNIFGDTTYRLAEVSAAAPPESAWYARHSQDTVVRYYLHQAFQSWWGWTPEQSYANISAGLGIAYLVAILAIARRLGHTAAEKVLLFGAASTSGYMLLFFGYIEVYSSVLATGMLFLWATLKYADGEVGLWLPAAALFPVGVSHLLGLFAAPALLCAVVYRHGWHRHLHLRPLARLRLGPMPLLAFSCTAAGWALFQLVRPTSAVPLFLSYAHIPYTVFSPIHLAEMANQHMLVALPAWMGLFLAVWIGRCDPPGGQPPRRDPGGRTQRFGEEAARDPKAALLAVSALVSVCMMALVDPALGRLDWDLMSIHAPLWVIAGTHFFITRCRRNQTPVGARVTAVILMLSLAHTAPWIALQQFPDRAVASIEAMIQWDPHRHGDRNLKLGIRLEDMGFIEAAIRQYKRAVSWDDRYFLSYYNLGRALQKLGRIDDAVVYYLKAIELNPDYPHSHNNLGGIYHKRGRSKEAVFHYERAMQLAPDNAAAHNNAALAYYDLGRLEEAIAAYKRTIALAPRMTHAYFNLAAVQAKVGNYSAAASALERFVRLEPRSGQGFRNLSKAYAQLGDTTVAREAYGRYRRLTEAQRVEVDLRPGLEPR